MYVDLKFTSSRTGLLAIPLLYLALASLYTMSVPALEAPDEVGHYQYVLHLLRTRTLPKQHIGKLDESHQPPLYYLLAALAALPSDFRDPVDSIANPRFVLAGQGGTEKNLLLHTDREAFPFQGQALTLHLARAVSILKGLFTVLLTIATGRDLFPNRPAIALLAGAVVAFNPQFLFMNSVLNNDNLLIMAATGVWWQTLRALKRPDHGKEWFYVSLWVALLISTKLTEIRDGPEFLHVELDFEVRTASEIINRANLRSERHEEGFQWRKTIMRPKLSLLDDDLIVKIITEAREILCRLGVEIHNRAVLSMLADHGAAVTAEKWHACLRQDMIDQALKTVPRSFKLYDVLGKETHDFIGDNVYFTPGSAAINILDGHSGEIRKPTTSDYIRFVKLVSGLCHIASQSTALIPADVHAKISDSYRLYLSLLYGEKPVVTGAFTIEAFEIMKNLQTAVRGSAEALKAKPLTIFSCCPTAPIKWSDVTSQNLVDCARWSIPVEFISMPLSGFMAPVTLVGTLIQQTAETLSGLVISQLVNPGHPVLYGGSPAIFDIRFETTPMGAIETMMLDCANSEIGKYLGLPTQGYIALSDAKLLDAQAGLETTMGATLAALSGINSISGPGMLDFESCQSLEKLVVDDEICGMTYRLIRGIEPREDFPAIPIFQELLREKHLLIAKHTRRHLREEIIFPGAVIDRANRARWREEGGLTLRKRAMREVSRLIEGYVPSRLPANTKSELTRLMEFEARRYGMNELPKREE